MPKVRTSRTVYPEGWELIEPTLRDLETKMREGMYVCVCVYDKFWRMHHQLEWEHHQPRVLVFIIYFEMLLLLLL